MRRRVIAFDLDGTLAVTKSAISEVMALRLAELLAAYEVCVISGGKFEQFQVQVIDRLAVPPESMGRLHIMPTSGTKYVRFDVESGRWVVQYSHDLTPQQRAEIIAVLEAGAKELGLWEDHPRGDIIEDRGSQVTYSALGQEAPAESKYAWDPDGAKKGALRGYAARRLPDLEVHAGGTTSVDVTMAGVDKAFGMRQLMIALGLVMGDILFFGDKLEEGGNDHPVLAMGIDCVAVRNCDETAVAIEAIVRVS